MENFIFVQCCIIDLLLFSEEFDNRFCIIKAILSKYLLICSVLVMSGHFKLIHNIKVCENKAVDNSFFSSFAHIDFEST